jgi:hypothetical protein
LLILLQSCGLKVETKDPEWHRTLTKVLKRIKGNQVLNFISIHYLISN